MSIAELIMTGTERASKSTDWVADSLAKIGDNVSKVLVDRQQQKQAQEMLPMFQQSLQEAMTYANEGDAGLAYAKLMPFLADPAVVNNPYMKNVIPAFEKGIQFAAENYARNIRAEAYRDRYSGGGGNGDGGGDVNTIIDALNQDGDSEYDGGVIEQPDIYSQAGARGEAFPFKQAVGQTTQPQGMPAMNQPLQGTPEQKAMQRQDMDARMVEVPLPGEEQAPLAQGPIRKDEPPSQKTLKRFTQLQDYFNSLPLKEQKYKMDQTSVIFKDQDAISSYTPPKGTGVVELSKAAGIGVPDAFAVQLPAKVSKYVLGSVSVGKSGVRYNIDNKIQGDAEAKDAIKWLEDWQSASVAVGSNPQLRGLLSQAGNDALNIDISDAPINDDSEDGGKMIELQVRDKPDTKIQVPESAGKLIQMLKAQTSAANTHNAKFLRLKQAKPTAEAPAPTQAGIPANQLTTTAPEIPEEAMALQKIVEQGQAAKAGESAKNVEKRIKDIDTQIKQLSAPIFQFGGTTSASGVKTREEKRIKTSEEAQADIQKIAQLKEQKNILVAQSEGRVFATEEEAKRSTKKFGKGTIIYIAGKPAKVQ